MRQAIITKYHGPTDRMGSRITARCQARRRIFAWDYDLDVEENHAKAAHKLATELGWLAGGQRLVGGALPCGTGNCYVLREENHE